MHTRHDSLHLHDERSQYGSARISLLWLERRLDLDKHGQPKVRFSFKVYVAAKFWEHIVLWYKSPLCPVFSAQCDSELGIGLYTSS